MTGHCITKFIPIQKHLKHSQPKCSVSCQRHVFVRFELIFCSGFCVPCGLGNREISYLGSCWVLPTINPNLYIPPTAYVGIVFACHFPCPSVWCLVLKIWRSVFNFTKVLSDKSNVRMLKNWNWSSTIRLWLQIKLIGLRSLAICMGFAAHSLKFVKGFLIAGFHFSLWIITLYLC